MEYIYVKVLFLSNQYLIFSFLARHWFNFPISTRSYPLNHLTHDWYTVPSSHMLSLPLMYIPTTPSPPNVQVQSCGTHLLQWNPESFSISPVSLKSTRNISVRVPLEHTTYRPVLTMLIFTYYLTFITPTNWHKSFNFFTIGTMRNRDTNAFVPMEPLSTSESKVSWLMTWYCIGVVTWWDVVPILAKPFTQFTQF